jgi:pantetheine-phosphate adenylyltransferase
MAFRCYIQWNCLSNNEIERGVGLVRFLQDVIVDRIVCEIQCAESENIVRIARYFYEQCYEEFKTPLYILMPKYTENYYIPEEGELVFGNEALRNDSFYAQVLEKMPYISFSEYSKSDEYMETYKKYRSGYIDGTYDHLHSGHLLLLSVASIFSFHLTIGVCSDTIIKHKKHPNHLQTYSQRLSKIQSFINIFNPKGLTSYFELYDSVIPAAEGDYDVIIASSELGHPILEINSRRAQNSMKFLEKITVQVLSINESKISSSFVRESLEKNIFCDEKNITSYKISDFLEYIFKCKRDLGFMFFY